MYTTRNFKSKKQLKEAVAAGEKITVFQPNDMFGNSAAAPDYSGRITLEGPHYPEPHRWYASAILENGYVVKIS